FHWPILQYAWHNYGRYKLFSYGTLILLVVGCWLLVVGCKLITWHPCLIDYHLATGIPDF
ncbi:MAG: hypothetical protein KDC69_05550, partial [Flavobacteriaceae bacterium]|nr:hypothetical protein [Flavobacteriaceae bacterium]